LGGNSGFAGGDDFTVLPAVGALGQSLAEELDFTDVGFAVVGVGGDGVHRDVGGGGIQDEADRAVVGIPSGQGHPVIAGRSASGRPRSRTTSPCARPGRLLPLGVAEITPSGFRQSARLKVWINEPSAIIETSTSP
jgi:hypothetical protein